MKEQEDSINNSGTSSERQNRFGNYDLIRRIDTGGMGEVYLARQRTAFDREVAIKIIRSDLVHDATVRKRFRREAEVNAQIKHGHILPLLEFGVEGERLFFVTPYITGGTVAKRLKAGPLSLNEVYQLFTALVKAVAYIHRRGVVHRDLKPSNILLDQEENTGEIYVYLIDFGIASIQGQAASPPLTTVGTEVGTVAYMAPERLSGVAAPSNDIYSLGIILYQMLTGRLPLDGQRVPLPDPLEYVVKRCIAPIGEGRFTSAEEVLNEFERAYQFLNAPSKQAPISLTSSPDYAVTPRRINRPRPTQNFNQEVKTLQRSDDMPPLSRPQPQQPAGMAFIPGDYDSTTVDVDVSDMQEMRGTQGTQSRPGGVGNFGPLVPPPPVSRPVRVSKPRRNPLIALVTLLTVFVLLAIAGLLFFGFQSVVMASANINFGPQVHAISKVFSIKGSPSHTKVDESTSTIPVKTLSVSKTGSQSGQTSQQCSFFFGCQNVVTPEDVNKYENQLKQSLDSQITIQVKQQLQGLAAVQVSSINFTTTSLTSDPPTGTESKTVTVTITEQGQVAYILNQDAQTLARLLLNKEVRNLGANYILINTLTQIGQPVVQSVDNSSQLVLIKIAAGGVAEYHFPRSQLTAIQKAVKGMKLKNAITFIKQQPGVDANTVAIHLSFGDTMPGDLQQIKIVPINTTNFPSVVLTPVPSTPTPTSTP